MLADQTREPFADDTVHGLGQQAGEHPAGRDGADQFGLPSLDPALFSLLLGRIERLSRELGRAETQRTLVEQHIARLEQQIEKLTRQQEHVS